MTEKDNSVVNYDPVAAFGPLGPITVKAFRRDAGQYTTRIAGSEASVGVAASSHGIGTSSNEALIDLVNELIATVNGLVTATNNLAASVSSIESRLNSASVNVTSACTGSDIQITATLTI